MKKKLPALKSDKAAEEFVAKADLTEYDLTEMKTVRFEFQPKTERVNMRLPRELLKAVRTMRRQGRNALSALHPPNPGSGGISAQKNRPHMSA